MRTQAVYPRHDPPGDARRAEQDEAAKYDLHRPPHIDAPRQHQVSDRGHCDYRCRSGDRAQ